MKSYLPDILPKKKRRLKEQSEYIIRKSDIPVLDSTMHLAYYVESAAQSKMAKNNFNKWAAWRCLRSAQDLVKQTKFKMNIRAVFGWSDMVKSVMLIGSKVIWGLQGNERQLKRLGWIIWDALSRQRRLSFISSWEAEEFVDFSSMNFQTFSIWKACVVQTQRSV